MKQNILLLQAAALGYNFLTKNLGTQKFYGLDIKPLSGVFPALTCVVQATMRTGSLPSGHGIVGNGFFSREQRKPLFWEQSSRLIEGKRIWDKFRLNGGKVAQMFIQQSLGNDSDILFSPAPIHKHHGGMIMDCFSEPSYLNGRLTRELGSTFPLHHYWGPMASKKSSQWIAKAVISVMKNETPGLLYAYLPHLDYALQRYAADSKASKNAFIELNSFVGEILAAARNENYLVIIFGDYPITAANDVIFPNKILRDAGFLKMRNIKKMHYPNFYTSAAFSLVDHQIAHVYLFDRNATEEIKKLFSGLPCIDRILAENTKNNEGIAHPRSGDFVLVAKQGYWFDYRWWDDKSEAPEYAFHVDIHNKPGYDPCELLWGWPPSISRNPYRIKGTHGRVDDNEPVFYASDMELPDNPKTLVELSGSIEQLLNSEILK